MRNANKNVMPVYSLDDVHLREELNYKFNNIQNLNTHFILRTKKDEKPTKNEVLLSLVVWDSQVQSLSRFWLPILNKWPKYINHNLLSRSGGTPSSQNKIQNPRQNRVPPDSVLEAPSHVPCDPSCPRTSLWGLNLDSWQARVAFWLPPGVRSQWRYVHDAA